MGFGHVPFLAFYRNQIVFTKRTIGVMTNSRYTISPRITIVIELIRDADSIILHSFMLRAHSHRLFQAEFKF